MIIEDTLFKINDSGRNNKYYLRVLTLFNNANYLNFGKGMNFFEEKSIS